MGEWENDVFKYGIKTVINGTTKIQYIGSFDKNKKGSGVIKYPSGEMYHGEWLFDQRHGRGIIINKDKSIISGVFEKDKLISS